MADKRTLIALTAIISINSAWLYASCEEERYAPYSYARHTTVHRQHPKAYPLTPRKNESRARTPNKNKQQEVKRNKSIAIPFYVTPLVFQQTLDTYDTYQNTSKTSMQYQSSYRIIATLALEHKKLKTVDDYSQLYHQFHSRPRHLLSPNSSINKKQAQRIFTLQRFYAELKNIISGENLVIEHSDKYSEDNPYVVPFLDALLPLMKQVKRELHAPLMRQFLQQQDKSINIPQPKTVRTRDIADTAILTQRQRRDVSIDLEQAHVNKTLITKDLDEKTINACLETIARAIETNKLSEKPSTFKTGRLERLQDRLHVKLYQITNHEQYTYRGLRNREEEIRRRHFNSVSEDTTSEPTSTFNDDSLFAFSSDPAPLGQLPLPTIEDEAPTFDPFSIAATSNSSNSTSIADSSNEWRSGSPITQILSMGGQPENNLSREDGAFWNSLNGTLNIDDEYQQPAIPMTTIASSAAYQELDEDEEESTEASGLSQSVEIPRNPEAEAVTRSMSAPPGCKPPSQSNSWFRLPSLPFTSKK